MKEYELDSFCGTTFNDGNLTVIGHNGLTGSKKKYVCHCSVCAKDPELHGDGVYHSQKGSLTSGLLPCGCSKSPRWSDRQYRVLITRKGTGKFDLVDKSEITTNRQKVTLKCLIDGNEWKPTVNNILNGGNGCPCCGVTAQRKGDPDPAKNVINRCAELGVTFNGFIGGEYKSNSSRLDLKCKCGNCWKPVYNSFVRGKGCPACADYGYSPNKQGNHYLVKWVHPVTGHEFIKFGITNRSVKSRVSQQARSTDYEPKIIRVTTHEVGSDTAGLERDLKRLQSTHGVSNVDQQAFADGHTETLPIVALNAAHSVIDEYCFGLVLPR